MQLISLFFLRVLGSSHMCLNCMILFVDAAQDEQIRRKSCHIGDKGKCIFNIWKRIWKIHLYISVRLY